MRERIRKARAEESGFTLIELLIVIVILGILAAIVVFAVGGITDRGTKSACKSTVATINTASEAYYAKNNAYAGGIGELGRSEQFLKSGRHFDRTRDVRAVRWAAQHLHGDPTTPRGHADHSNCPA